MFFILIFMLLLFNIYVIQYIIQLELSLKSHEFQKFTEIQLFDFFILNRC